MQTAENNIFILEYSGERRPFDAGELQSDLIRCFLNCGKQELAYLAEEIVLAVEYTLLTSGRPELVFGRGELGSAVVRMLEETGFPEVAAGYRADRGERYVTIVPGAETIGGLLSRTLACTPEKFEKIVSEVCRSLEKLKISEVPPQLVLELGRYYAHQQMPGQKPDRKKTYGQAVRQAEIHACLPACAKPLLDDGILRINAISPLFPALRFVFLIEKFAVLHEIGTPVMELELAGLLAEPGAVLEACRQAVNARFSQEKTLPVLLTIPDMSDFAVRHLGSDRLHFQRAGREIAKLLTAPLNCELYKLAMS